MQNRRERRDLQRMWLHSIKVREKSLGLGCRVQSRDLSDT